MACSVLMHFMSKLILMGGDLCKSWSILYLQVFITNICTARFKSLFRALRTTYLSFTTQFGCGGEGQNLTWYFWGHQFSQSNSLNYFYLYTMVKKVNFPHIGNYDIAVSHFWHTSTRHRLTALTVYPTRPPDFGPFFVAIPLTLR